MKFTILLTLGLVFSLPLRAEEEKAPAAPATPATPAAPAAPEKAPAKEKASPEATFKKKDKNSDSFLSLEEFVGKAVDAAKTKAEEAFKKKDKDSDSKLTLAEFSASAGKGGGKKKK